MSVEVLKRDERTLIAECEEIYSKKIKRQAESIIFGFWEIGAKFIQYEAEGWIERGYGESTVKRVAEELNIYWTQLYAAKNFAERCPTEQDVRDLMSQMKEKGISANWSNIRTKVLPKNAGLQKEEKHQQLMAEGERHASKAEEVITQLTEEINRGNVTEENREEVESVRAHLKHALQDANKALQAFPKPQREANRDYLDWIKEQPEWMCILTGDLEADPHHIHTVGAGGSDALVVPLSREMHDDAHKGSFWTGHNLRMLAEWFYSKHEIDKRWLQEQKQ